MTDNSFLNKDKLWNKIKKYLYYIIIFLSILIILIFYNILVSQKILINLNHLKFRDS